MMLSSVNNQERVCWLCGLQTLSSLSLIHIQMCIRDRRNTTPTVGGFRVNQYANYGIVNNHGVDMSLNIHQQIGKVKLSARAVSYTHLTCRENIKKPDRKVFIKAEQDTWNYQ